MMASNEAVTPLNPPRRARNGGQGFLNSSGKLDPPEVYPPEVDQS